jgi:hypothetical protein
MSKVSGYIGHGPRISHYRWRDLNLLALENEKIRLVIWLDHGADILEFRHKPSDIDALWKNPQVYPPVRQALDQPHEGRSEFYDTFHGGWFISMPNGFFPAHYYGAPIGCHGDMQSIPWEVTHEVESPERAEIQLTGRSRRTPLTMTRKLTLSPDEAWVSIEDTVGNRSTQRLAIAWAQHTTFGGPLIEGAELVTGARKLSVPPADRPELSQLVPEYVGKWPFAREQATGNLRDCSRVAPAGSEIEHVVQLTGWETGWGCVWNEGRELGFGLRWDEAQFPYAWSWSAGRGTDTYPIWGSCNTITLQPGTSPLLPFEKLIERNEVAWIEDSGTLSTSITAGFVNHRDEMLEAANRMCI